MSLRYLGLDLICHNGPHVDDLVLFLVVDGLNDPVRAGFPFEEPGNLDVLIVIYHRADRYGERVLVVVQDLFSCLEPFHQAGQGYCRGRYHQRQDYVACYKVGDRRERRRCDKWIHDSPALSLSKDDEILVTKEILESPVESECPEDSPVGAPE